METNTGVHELRDARVLVEDVIVYTKLNVEESINQFPTIRVYLWNVLGDTLTSVTLCCIR